MFSEAGKVIKENVKLIEYSVNENGVPEKIFIQCGVVGFFLNSKELKNLYTVLNYYMNIGDFADCKVEIEGENVAIQRG